MALELHPDAAKAIGMITGYCSQIDFYLCLILEKMMRITRKQSIALWYSSTNHKARMDMIKAVSDATITDCALKKELADLLARVQDCVHARNSIQHDLWSILGRGGVPVHLVRYPLKPKGRSKNTIQPVTIKSNDLEKSIDVLGTLSKDLFNYRFRLAAKLASAQQESSS
jgi:hypothetical protein